MAGTLDYYGYDDKNIAIITEKDQDEYRQNQKDVEQDKNIKRNYDDNVVQQEEIDNNSEINNIQIGQIDDLYDKIEAISGGTIADLDLGEWQ